MLMHIDANTFTGESLPGGPDRRRHPPPLSSAPPHLPHSLLRPTHNTHHQGEVGTILTNFFNLNNLLSEQIHPTRLQ